MTRALRLQQNGAVLEVCLDVPRRRNALSRPLLHELRRAFAQLPPSVRAVVLSGTGTVFSAGADFADLTGTSHDLAYDDDLEAAITALRGAPVPVVAAIEGPCLGAGAELALSCDLRVAGRGAWFQVPAVRLGLLYNPRSIARLHRILPRTALTRMLLFGERFDAADAFDAGLATRITDSGTALDTARAIARGAGHPPTPALAHTRRLLSELDDGEFDEQKWNSIRAELMDSEHRKEAVAAASERYGGATETTGIASSHR